MGLVSFFFFFLVLLSCLVPRQFLEAGTIGDVHFTLGSVGYVFYYLA